MQNTKLQPHTRRFVHSSYLIAIKCKIISGNFSYILNTQKTGSFLSGWDFNYPHRAGCIWVHSLTGTPGPLHCSVILLGEQAPPRAPGQILLPPGWPSIGSSPTFLNSQCSWVGFKASGLRLTSRLHLLCCLSVGLAKSSVGKAWELLTEARYDILFAPIIHAPSVSEVPRESRAGCNLFSAYLGLENLRPNSLEIKRNKQK